MLQNPLMQGSLVVAALLLVLAACGFQQPQSSVGDRLDAASAISAAPADRSPAEGIAEPAVYYSDAQRARWKSATGDLTAAKAPDHAL